MCRGIGVLGLSILCSFSFGSSGSTYRAFWNPSIEPNNHSASGKISGNGRFVAYTSAASNLVPFDTNNTHDVFVFDRLLGTTERVSVSTSGLQGNSSSSGPEVSFDGRFVAFASSATNLVLVDTNDETDVFVHDRLTRETSLVSVSTGGVQGDAPVYGSGISPDGRVVIFGSFSTNLVPGDTNGAPDVFLRDRATGQTRRVSIAYDGAEGNSGSYAFSSSLSNDGRFIAFSSQATNLVASDLNEREDVFVRDTVSGTTTLVSVSSTGVQGTLESDHPDISYDGRFVAFQSISPNLIPNDTNNARDVFLRDTGLGQTTRVSLGPGGVQSSQSADSYSPSMDATGRFIAFYSHANNFVPNPQGSSVRVYIHDRLTFSTYCCSKSTLGTLGNAESNYPSLSSDASVVAFTSNASNLIPLDLNGKMDMFVHDLTSEVVFPESWQLVRGTLVSGDLFSLFASDDNRLTLRPGVVLGSNQAPAQIVVGSHTGSEQASRIELFVESSGSSANITQTLSLFDYAASQPVTLGANSMTGSDRSISRFVLENPSRFINHNGEIRAILSWRANGPVLQFPWQVQIDHVYWAISPSE